MKILTFVLVLISSFSFSQAILLEQDVNADTIPEIKGPNLKHFSHLYAGIGFAAGSDLPGSEIMYGLSSEITYGYRYKRRFCNTYAIGFDVVYHSTIYRLKQDSAKVLPNNITHDKEKLTFHNLGIGVYNRFNYGKRGNYIGNFIDIGARLDWPFSTVHFIKDKYDIATNNNGGTVKSKTSSLIYIRPFNYSAIVRLGFNRYVITASYRLSDIFKDDPEIYEQYEGIEKYPELPVLIIGFEIGMYK